MIAKISKSSNIYGALAYNDEKVSENLGEVLLTANIRSVELDCTTQDVLNAFAERFDANKAHGKTKNTVTHISLNPAPEDKIDDFRLCQIAEEYMEEMGYKEQPYIVYKHTDIDRHHLHIVTTDILKNGKRKNVAHERRRSKDITDAIEKKYRLGKADIRLGKNQEFKPEKVNHKKPKVGQQIKSVVRHFLDYDFGSINEFAAMLAPYNIELQQIKGEYEDGNTYSGILYWAVNDKKKKIFTPIKASSLGKTYGYKNLLSKLFQKNASLQGKIDRGRTKTILKTEMQKATSLSDLQKRLQKQNIDLVLRKNEQGRIYGATIIDHEEKFVANGSKLGKEFSANVFEKLSQTLEANSLSNTVEFDIPSIGYENITGGAIDIAHGRKNDVVDDTEEMKKRKKLKKKSVYRMT